MADIKIALMIIYNHRYDKNIHKLNDIYGKKFSYIYHIVPFYDGNDPNVIPVYESSYYFSGYIAQAYQYVKNLGFTNYVFIADDMILNPILDENNIFDKLGMSDDSSFISNLLELNNVTAGWQRVYEALGYNYKDKRTGAEIENFLPKYEAAQNRFIELNLNDSFSINRHNCRKHIFKKNLFTTLSILTTRSAFYIFKGLVKTMFHGSYPLSYPLVGGYSDFFIVDQQTMPKFCQYCGAFAATKLFVELAIPTALVLSARKILTQDKTKLKGEAIWGENIQAFGEKFKFSLSDLYANFPKDRIFIHPVKLSKWQ